MPAIDFSKLDITDPRVQEMAVAELMPDFQAMQEKGEPVLSENNMILMELNADDVNLAPQVRTHYRCENLAEAIATEGLQQPPTIACFTSKSLFAIYLAIINKMLSKNPDTPCDLSICPRTKSQWVCKRVMINGKNRKVYFVVIAGHRRVLAIRHLWHIGCKACNHRLGRKPYKGECYKRHSFQGKETFTARVFINPNPLGAYQFQISENCSQEQIGVEQWAKIIGELYRMQKNLGQGVNQEQFAAQLGIGVEKLRNAIRYIELPLAVQGLVEEKQMRFGVAVQLSRLQKTLGWDDGKLLGYISRVAAANLSVKAMKKLVNEEIQKEQTGQRTLDDELNFLINGISSLTDAEKIAYNLAQEKLRLRELIGPGTHKAIRESALYVESMVRMMEDGSIKIEHSPFLDELVLEQTKKLSEMLQAVNSHLQRLLGFSDEELQKMLADPIENIQLINALEARIIPMMRELDKESSSTQQLDSG